MDFAELCSGNIKKRLPPGEALLNGHLPAQPGNFSAGNVLFYWPRLKVPEAFLHLQ